MVHLFPLAREHDDGALLRFRHLRLHPPFPLLLHPNLQPLPVAHPAETLSSTPAPRTLVPPGKPVAASTGRARRTQALSWGAAASYRSSSGAAAAAWSPGGLIAKFLLCLGASSLPCAFQWPVSIELGWLEENLVV